MPLRITRRTAGQRRHRNRCATRAAALLEGASLDEERGRALLEGAFPELRRALWRSPGWTRRLRERWLSPDDLASLDDLAGFPTLDRRALEESWADLPDTAAGAGELVVVETSGSTGRPLRVVRDEYDCLHMWAVLRFWLAFLALPLPPRPRVVLLCALPGGLQYSTRLPILENGALHRLSTGDPRTPARLRRLAPAVIFSDPAGAHWLAARGGLPPPRLFLSSAQHLSASLRTRLAAVLPAPVVDYYSTTETGPVAWECLQAPGRRHVLVPDVWVESVAGELVVTRLRPGPLPLVRYRPGDRGSVERDECRCGYRGWSILGFEGRHACRFAAPGGRWVDAWQLAWLFKHHPLSGFRLVQTGLAAFRLELEGTAATPELEATLRAALGRLGWSRPAIEVARHEHLDAPGGKPEPFRHEIATPEPELSA